MIVLWKKEDCVNYAASWQGMRLTLAYETQLKRWVVRVNGERCRQRWFTPTAAMNQVDSVMEQMIMRQRVEARQGAPSAARIVRRRHDERTLSRSDLSLSHLGCSPEPWKENTSA